MNAAFRPFLRKFLMVCFDNILVYSTCLEAHLLLLQQVLEVLQQNQLYAKQSKCHFGSEEVIYLGHIISGEGVRTNSNKTKAMLNWPAPNSLQSLRGFLGLIGYYRKFIMGYDQLTSPLTDLLQKDSFHWDVATQYSFDQLKAVVTSPLILALPDFSKHFL